MENKKIIIHTDGGSRGNPGPSGIGVLIESHDHDPQAPKWQKKYKRHIGQATNNIAEYSAVILALKEAKKILKKDAKETDIELRSDSELLVKQVMGVYRVKDLGLQPLYREVLELMPSFKSVRFLHIPRENNKEADKLVNEALDGL